jgi:hypothetical protein
MWVTAHKHSDKERAPNVLILAVVALSLKVGFQVKIVKMGSMEFPVSSGSHFHELWNSYCFRLYCLSNSSGVFKMYV